MQILYIQMEYCEKTLDNVIMDESLSSTPERLWNLFRQVSFDTYYVSFDTY